MKSAHTDSQECLWLVVEDAAGYKLLKYMDTTLTRQSVIATRHVAVIESYIYCMTDVDTIDRYDVRFDRVDARVEVVDNCDTVNAVVAKCRCLYVMYQTVIGELVISVWSAELVKLTSISKIWSI